jgi:nucleotide-binding universal stress UspA family protein
MSSIRQVLVPIDFSECSCAAFAYGAELARALEAKLTALHVYSDLPVTEAALVKGEHSGADVLRGIEADVRRLVGQVSTVDPPAQTVVCEGETVEQIFAHVAANDVDLIVMGTHGRRGPKRLAVGSVADRVARRASCPVLVVPPRAPIQPVARVLCGLDLQPASAETLELAAEIAQATRARLTVLHAVELVRGSEPWALPAVDEASVRRSIAATAEERLSTLIAEHAAGLPVELRVVFGRVQRVLERAAANGMSLAVVGARSTGVVHRVLFGSTAEHLLHAGACPVLFVRRRSGTRRRRESVEHGSAVSS